MRITHIIDYLAPGTGHAEFCGRLAREQHALGHECTILTGEWCAGFALAGPLGNEVHRIPPRGLRVRGLSLDPGLARRVGRLLAATAPAVVHVHGFWHPVIAAAILAARRRNIPVVLSPHGAMAPWVRQQHRGRKQLFWALCRNRYRRDVALFHAASAREAADLQRQGLGATVVVPPGVDLPTQPAHHGCEPGDGTAAASATRVRMVLFLSRLHPLKGMTDLVRAWALLRPVGWQVRIVGPDWNDHRAAVRSLVQQLGVTGDFTFLDGAFGEERDAHYRAADVFVLPSLTENFGMVVAEALAHGLPVITTTATPWRELQGQGCGWCVDPGAESLVGALRAATSLSDTQRRDMGLRGRQWVAASFNWKTCAETLVAAYGRVTEHRPRDEGVRSGTARA